MENVMSIVLAAITGLGGEGGGGRLKCQQGGIS